MTVVEHHSVDELQEFFRREKDARVSKRIWMVWQARSGLTEPQITTAIGMARRTVQDWVRRYNAEGLAGVARSCGARPQADLVVGGAAGRRRASRRGTEGRRCLLAAGSRLPAVH